MEINYERIDSEKLNLNENFPEIQAIIPYGSYFFPQGEKVIAGKPDYIFVVEDAGKWHEENRIKNKDHYTVQEKCFKPNERGGYFLPFVYHNTSNGIKYGVISKAEIIKDLTQWGDIYIAGRLQKPNADLRDLEEDHEMKEALVSNQEKAFFLAAWRLLYGKQELKKNTRNLLRSIVDLSYKGDIRMILPIESSDKVDNITDSYKEDLFRMYQEYIENYFVVDQESEEVSLKNEQDFKKAFERVFSQFMLLHKLNSGSEVSQKVEKIILFSSLKQPTQSTLVTSNLIEAIVYVGNKILKKIKRKKLSLSKL